MNESDLRDLLLTAGLSAEEEGPLALVSSYSNDVWIGREVVLRVCRDTWEEHYQRRYWTAIHEQEILRWLPSDVPHARVIASGLHKGRPWLLFQRLRGQVLGRAWPGLTVSERREVILQLGAALRALHKVPIPETWQRPDLRPEALALCRTATQIAAPYQQPPERIVALADAARQVPGVDQGLAAECVDFVRERLPVFAEDTRVLVHADLHWENLLIEKGVLTGVLDFEGARPAAPDLELDVILRFCRWPHLPVAEDYERLMKPADFRQVPGWLAEGYPELFAAPHLRERLEAYAVLHDLRQGIQHPEAPGKESPPWSSWNRLRAVVAGASYLTEWS